MGGGVATDSRRAPGARRRATAHYRPQLDGLRAVAVYLVVAYHAGIHAFSGGFIGVDVFFVLSGYLVTLLLLRDFRAAGRIDFRRFYSRRFRRLLPAAFVALVVTAAVYTAVAAPADVSNARRRVPVGVPLRRQLALHQPVERLLRGERQHEPGRALLVAGGRGAVLPVLAAPAERRVPRRRPRRRPAVEGRAADRSPPGFVDLARRGAAPLDRQPEPRVLRHRHPRVRAAGRCAARDDATRAARRAPAPPTRSQATRAADPRRARRRSRRRRSTSARSSAASPRPSRPCALIVALEVAKAGWVEAGALVADRGVPRPGVVRHLPVALAGDRHRDPALPPERGVTVRADVPRRDRARVVELRDPRAARPAVVACSTATARL